MNIYLVRMNDGSWGCLSNIDNHFIVRANDEREAEMIARNTNSKYLKQGTHVEYVWDCFAKKVEFDEKGLFKR